MIESENSLARALPPEDVRTGQYVSVLHVVDEYLPLFCDVSTMRGLRPLQMLLLPSCGGTPLKVVEVCLPFVLFERPDGKHRTLDVRRYRLERVSKRYGEETFKRVKADEEKEKADDKDDE